MRRGAKEGSNSLATKTGHFESTGNKVAVIPVKAPSVPVLTLGDGELSVLGALSAPDEDGGDARDGDKGQQGLAAGQGGGGAGGEEEERTRQKTGYFVRGEKRFMQ